MEKLIGSVCPFLSLSLSTLEQYGFGKGVMGVIAVQYLLTSLIMFNKSTI
jgi:hypothetical protein